MISRFTAKVLANSLLAGISIAMLAALFVSFHHVEILEEFGSEWVDDYAKSLRHKAKAALAQEKKTGRTDALVTLLETPLWSEAHLSDRAYPLKRKLLERLCVNLKQQGDYSALAHWASEWLSLNERNLNARAFWFEAIRHFPDEENEGLQGLITNQRAFPENNYLSLFLIKAYKEINNYGLANQLLQQVARSEAQTALNDWQVYWATSSQKKFSETLSKHLAPKFNHRDQLALVTHIPTDSVRLRIDPPRRSRIRIYQIEVQIDNQTIRFPTSTLEFDHLRREEDGLIADRKLDPQFYLSIGKYLESADREEVTVSIRFYVDVVIGEDELPLVDFFDRE
jgi:hypothetical protein